MNYLRKDLMGANSMAAGTLAAVQEAAAAANADIGTKTAERKAATGPATNDAAVAMRAAERGPGGYPLYHF